MIDLLQITPDEERHMKTLISTRVKRERDYRSRREARGYQARRAESAERIVKLHREGLSSRALLPRMDAINQL